MPAVEQTDATLESGTLRYADVELSGPVQLIEKGLYFVFALVSLWIWCRALDNSRPFFEKKGYRRIAKRILIVKIIGFALFVAFVVFGFSTGRI